MNPQFRPPSPPLFLPPPNPNPNPNPPHSSSYSSLSKLLLPPPSPPRFPISLPPPNPNPNPPPSSFDDQSLRDEVQYLHWLWRRGPPPPPSSSSSSNPSLKPNSKPFKRKLDPEWPAGSSPPSSASESGWGEFKRRANPSRRPATAGEAASIVASKIQHKALEACAEFFEDDDEEEEEEEDEEEEDDMFGESVEYAFFCRLFEGDKELRGYYEKNFNNGGFVCLVCAGIKQKLRKKYVNCHSLVQHCVTISKTKKKKAHRTFGQVVCKVLGWDINNLPPSVPPETEGAGTSKKQSVQAAPQSQVVVPSESEGASKQLLKASLMQDPVKDVNSDKLGASKSGVAEETVTNNDANALDVQLENEAEGSASTAGGEMKDSEVQQQE